MNEQITFSFFLPKKDNNSIFIFQSAVRADQIRIKRNQQNQQQICQNKITFEGNLANIIILKTLSQLSKVKIKHIIILFKTQRDQSIKKEAFKSKQQKEQNKKQLSFQIFQEESRFC
ncbi:hypothetical protein ABPG74_014837 [Tetrahymena malaccensis]